MKVLGLYDPEWHSAVLILATCAQESSVDWSPVLLYRAAAVVLLIVEQIFHLEPLLVAGPGHLGILVSSTSLGSDWTFRSPRSCFEHCNVSHTLLIPLLEYR